MVINLLSWERGISLSSIKTKLVDTNIGRLAFTARNAVELIRMVYRFPGERRGGGERPVGQIFGHQVMFARKRLC
jgi:hypothetical protein